VTENRTILLWGIPEDAPMAAMQDALRRANSDFIFLNQHAVLQTTVELIVGSSVEGQLRIGDQDFDLAQIKSAYLRPYEPAAFPQIARGGPHSRIWRHAHAVYQALHSWSEITDALVVNRPGAAAVNNSKPYQAALIESLGFRTPKTLITTDPALALDFWRQHEVVIYKSISAVRSIVSRLSDRHRSRLADIANCPTQFQHYVAGIEFRVHVVGDEIFSCAIVSAADDYRYSDGSVQMQACELPPEVAETCRRLAQSMNLHVAGIDLRCTPQGDWYCFEVNPSPGFTFFEDQTGLAIANSIARFLMRGPGETDNVHPTRLDSDESLYQAAAVS
jgi:glutathione synthase/RimK-type ligase-like ATP-grasp enzyme